jgi:DNA invertase Pin-like site-specific DNA recombinase/dihydroneopterin aldolase
MKRPHRFQPRTTKETQQTAWTPIELPLSEVVAVYARRSDPTAVKKSNTSNEMQTDDLVDLAHRLGWSDDKIIVFAQDMGKSGKLRIDEREGLRAIVSDIEAGIIKAVIVFLEDRLFRDETQIQVNVFIDICRQHNVLIITPHMTYNFNNRFHVKQFRWRCEEAADYLKDYIQARLVEGKHRVSKRGEYTGGGLPPGYIVDREEKITVDGVEVKNPSYKKYVIYQPHAEIVIWLFDRYLMLGGNLTKLCQEILTMPVLFPDFPPDIEVRYTAKIQLRRVPGGYHVTKRGLTSILTNVVYLGWWFYQGKVISKNNHPAIMEGKADLFWFAFNRLSPFTPDGEPNNLKKQPPRYQQEGTEGTQALLKDIINSEFLGSVYVVAGGTKQGKRAWYYAIHEKDLSLVVQYHSAIAASYLDSVYVARFLDHLKHTTDFTHYRDYITQVKKEVERETTSIRQQLQEIEKQSEGILASLKLPPKVLKEKTRMKLAQDYEALQEQQEALENKLTSPERTRRVQKLLEYYDLIEKLAQHWHKLPFEDRKALAEALTEEVLIDVLSPHWMRLVIKWRIPHWGTDTALIWRVDGLGGKWTEEENDILRLHYPTDDRASILARLPHRSWHAITFQANQLKLCRSSQMRSNSPVLEFITLLDWQFMQEQGIVYDKNWQRREVMWLESDKVGGITSFIYQLSLNLLQ